MKKRIMSKTMAVLLSLLMCLQLIPAMTIQASAVDGTTWDGHAWTEFAEGDGTQATPYIIDTADKLSYLAQQVNAGTNYSGKYFKLTADLDLENKQWFQIGISVEPFGGNFDGNGKKITGLAIGTSDAPSGMDNVGLFGKLASGASIKNLSVSGAIVATRELGMLVGTVVESTILNCFSSGTINNTGDGNTVGGLVGSANGSIKNCGSETSISNTGSGVTVGAFAGSLGGGTTENCYATGSVNSTSTNAGTIIGGFVGAGKSAAITSCYAGNSATGGTGSTVGAFAGAESSTEPFIISKCYWDSTLNSSDKVTSTTGLTTTQMTAAAGEASSLVDTLNTGRDATWNEWSLYSDKNSGYPMFKAPMTDAEAVAADKEWLANIKFKFASGGTKDSVKSNFLLPVTGQNGSTITWAVASAGIVSITGGTATVTQPSVDTQVTLTATIAKGSASPVTEDFTITVLKPTVDGTTWDGKAYAFDITGGKGDTAGNPIIIDTAGKLAYLAQQVNVEDESNTHYAGKYFKQTENFDMAGKAWAPIGSFKFGDGADYRKAFAGHYDGDNKTISNLSVSAALNGNAGLFGGVAEVAVVEKVKLVNVNITANGGEYVGGLTSANGGTIQNCSVTGTVAGKAVVGGLVGIITAGIVKQCSASASVAGVAAGGVASYIMGGSIPECYSDSTISVDGQSGGAFAGGIAPMMGAITIENCHSSGDISVETGKTAKWLGGFAGAIMQGERTTNIKNCYSRAEVGASSKSQAFCGTYAKGTISGCYYDSPIAKASQDPLTGVAGQNTDMMKTQSAHQYFRRG